MTSHTSRTTASHRQASAGFTLVEMLVSVALVVLMMSLFASVFQIVSQSVGTQRGLAENDQRARSAVTILRGDLQNRTFKSVIPFHEEETQEPPPDYRSRPEFADDKRTGYFYISENNPHDDTDDVLQFTMEAGISGKYFGKAATFPGFYPNQPDWDDGNFDNTSSSNAAEVAYFLRAGKLYRRVLLLRDPQDPTYLQPADQFDQALFDPSRTTNRYPDDAYFWNDYDFSAVRDVSHGGASFNLIGALTNWPPPGAIPPLGNPRERFGHYRSMPAGGPHDGSPREFVDGKFIGRFTHEETSSPNFGYPQRDSSVVFSPGPPPYDMTPGQPVNDGNPFDMGSISDNELRFDVDTGVVVEFAGNARGPRRSEDLLLSNVHSFDIKVWDEALGKFVDIGHDETDGSMNPIGDFNQQRNQHVMQGVIYGPHDNRNENRIFDTWHPNVDLHNDSTPEPPPFRPVGDDGIPKRLRAIQITIRYLDTASDQFRQVTLIQSLLDNE